MKTSIMDVPTYRRCCIRSAQNPINFQKFRQFKDITSTIDTVGPELGQMYLDFIQKKYPNLMSQMAEFARNDTVGHPAQSEYAEIGSICPTTLRYVKTFGDLIARFGDMTGWKIAEIGAGYGGLCRIIGSQTAFEKYSIIDLPETLELIKTYLDVFQTSNIEYVKTDCIEPDVSFDLVISNYAFSECQKEEQEKYFEQIIKNAKRGYMVCNYTGHVYGVSSYSSSEMKEKLESMGFNVGIEKEDPLLDPTISNLLITWSK
jgi:putative sugar O-methyltransferase